MRDDITGAVSDLVARVRPNDTSPARDGFEPDVVAPPFDVDIVYTWVDDGDPEWTAAYRDACRTDRPGDPAGDSSHAARYENHDELRYSMRSLWRYANWFRAIFVVTAGHRPAWLSEHPRINVVDHSDILDDGHLPTFNSHAIESALHRIDGLSERFVYMNDDFFVGRPLGFETLFDRSGRPQVSVTGGATRLGGNTPVGQYAAARHTDRIIESLTGSTAGYLIAHAPYPQLRSVTDELEACLVEEFESTASHTFRHPDDLSVPASLAPWYTIATGRADRVSPASEYVSIGHPTTAARLRRLRRRRDVDTFCLNWTEQTGEGWHRRIERFLRQRFPDAAPWENDA